MTDIDFIRFTVTVFLGGLSIGFAIFSFISSFRNNKQSKEALQKISEISGEIKAQLSTSISNQKDYTNKMLDSILSKTNYSEESESSNENSKVLDELLDLKIGEIENNLINIIDNKIQNQDTSISADVKEELENLKETIQEISKNENGIGLPIELKEQLIKWRRFPAYFLLIGGITREYSDGETSLNKIASKYYFPGEWEGALDQVESTGFIEYENGKVSIPPTVKENLEIWTTKNWPLILKLKANYKRKDEDSVTELEREIGSQFKI